jgi:hypothetical protein
MSLKKKPVEDEDDAPYEDALMAIVDAIYSVQNILCYLTSAINALPFHLKDALEKPEQ